MFNLFKNKSVINICKNGLNLTNIQKTAFCSADDVPRRFEKSKNFLLVLRLKIPFFPLFTLIIIVRNEFLVLISIFL